VRRASYWAGFLLVMLALTVPVAAGIGPVPEISGGSLATGLGLLSGALLIVRSRWRTK